MKYVIFDKTGTLTYGKPQVIQFKLLEALTSSITDYTQVLQRALAVIGSAESGSEHPLGQAIVDYAKQVRLAEIMRRIIAKECVDIPL